MHNGDISTFYPSLQPGDLNESVHETATDALSNEAHTVVTTFNTTRQKSRDGKMVKCTCSCTCEKVFANASLNNINIVKTIITIIQDTNRRRVTFRVTSSKGVGGFYLIIESWYLKQGRGVSILNIMVTKKKQNTSWIKFNYTFYAGL